jgi:hypothetical protein
VGLEDPFAHLAHQATSGHLVRRPSLSEEGMQTYLSATRRLRISACLKSLGCDVAIEDADVSDVLARPALWEGGGVVSSAAGCAQRRSSIPS